MLLAVPLSEESLKLILENHRQDDGNHANSYERVKHPILMQSQKVPLQGQQEGSQQSPHTPDDEKLYDRKMAQAEQIAEGILGKSGNKKQ